MADLALAQLTLTAAERLILANQYRILEHLHAGLRREYATRRHVVEQGTVEHYARLLSPPEATVGEQPARLRRGTDMMDDTDSTDRGGALTPW